MLKLKPVRGGARNAKRGENIPGGVNSMSKGPEVGELAIFRHREVSEAGKVSREECEIPDHWLSVILKIKQTPYLQHKVLLAHCYLSKLISFYSPHSSVLLKYGVFFMFPKHIRHLPASGPLHLLFPLPEPLMRTWIFICSEYLYTVQADLRDSAGLVPDHPHKANITIK